MKGNIFFFYLWVNMCLFFNLVRLIENNNFIFFIIFEWIFLIDGYNLMEMVERSLFFCMMFVFF